MSAADTFWCCQPTLPIQYPSGSRYSLVECSPAWLLVKLIFKVPYRELNNIELIRETAVRQYCNDEREF